MEHNPYDVSALGDALQYMLNRKQIAETGSVAPKVTPLARIPANGVEMNQSFAKQVLDRGAYGVIWPHVATVEQAYNAVASCRYARPKGAPLVRAQGRARRWPGQCVALLGPEHGRLLQEGRCVAVWRPKAKSWSGLMCESPEAIENLDDILANVPGIGFILIGEGDLSQALGFPRQYEHPEVLDAMRRIVETCHKHKVVVGNPHVTAKNHKRLLEEGYRFLMAAPTKSYGVVGLAQQAATGILMP